MIQCGSRRPWPGAYGAELGLGDESVDGFGDDGPLFVGEGIESLGEAGHPAVWRSREAGGDL